MKTGTSSLNPYAASYIPLFRRARVDADRQVSSTKELNRGYDAARFGLGQHQNISQSHGQSTGAVQTNDFSQWKDHNHGGSEFSTWTSRYLNEKPVKSEVDADMDMAYLEMMFPAMSAESLHGVYFTNNCDLDAAVDMLNQLEIIPEEVSSPDKLPDTLDIGDVPESGSHSQQVKKDAIGASGSGSSILSSTS